MAGAKVWVYAFGLMLFLSLFVCSIWFRTHLGELLSVTLAPVSLAIAPWWFLLLRDAIGSQKKYKAYLKAMYGEIQFGLDIVKNLPKDPNSLITMPSIQTTTWESFKSSEFDPTDKLHVNIAFIHLGFNIISLGTHLAYQIVMMSPREDRDRNASALMVHTRANVEKLIPLGQKIMTEIAQIADIDENEADEIKKETEKRIRQLRP